jgi:hypothetical protein
VDHRFAVGLGGGKMEVRAMNITDISTRVNVQNERSRLVTRGVEPSTELDGTVLTLVDTAQGSEAESSIVTDPLIRALVDKLPQPNSIWSIDDRAKWLKALAMIFNVVYRTDRDELKQPVSRHETVVASSALNGGAAKSA